MSIVSDITKVKGVGPAAKELLEKLGIYDVQSLLLHYPRDWEDRSRPLALMDWKLGKVCTEITVISQKWFGFGKTRTLKVYIEDESNKVFGTPACLVCFNRSFLQKTLVPGKRFKLYGSFSPRYGEIQSTSFELEAPDERGTAALGAILPVYPLTSGLNQNTLRKIMSNAVKEFTPNIKDELPPEIIKRYGFLHKADAIKDLHFPTSLEKLEKAKKTIIYEELFNFQMMIGLRSRERKNYIRQDAAALAPDDKLSPLQQRLIERLPFSLTSGQLSSINEINKDMDGKHPMARLLQGDVGSGKTLVSFLAALKAIEKGAQAVLMAPTELLARQHGDNAAKLLEPIGIKIAYLTGNLKAAGREQLLKALAAGEIDMLVGTHALFSKDVVYKNLRFVAVDEQHRFGVLQRKAIMEKGGEIPPDFLMMSATPIPQSLALTVFGDLDVSVIKDMPLGRKAIKTHLASESNANKVYDFVRRELSAGRQAYFVYPLIDGGEDEGDDDNELKNAVSMAEKLSKEIFPGIKLGLLHSKVEDESKRKIMEAFHKGDIKILAATSVVEVGVDVPNASCMVIEHAERFGLAALHQLRGRVGRGSDQSYCFLVYSGKLTEDAKLRLKIMLENNDGFVIAEEDLKLRGPGHIAGIEQSGYLKFGMADPVRDAAVLAQARKDALEMLDQR